MSGKVIYAAFVKDKDTGEYKEIERAYESKAKFILDLRRNGYAVNPDKVQPKEIYDYIVHNTNSNPWDWKQARKLYGRKKR